MSEESGDMLRLDFINALPQPIFVRDLGDKDWWWPVYDIDVQTGMLRIDVCGNLQVKTLSDCGAVRDAEGKQYETDELYSDYAQQAEPTKP